MGMPQQYAVLLGIQSIFESLSELMTEPETCAKNIAICVIWLHES